MRTSLYELYVFTICFISLAGTIVCLLGGLYAALGIAEPDWLMDDRVWTLHQSNDRYWQGTGYRHESDSGWLAKTTRPSEEELTRRRMESFEVERRSVRRESWLLLYMYGAGLAVSLVLFAVHWRLMRAFRPARTDAAAASPASGAA
jgi:hypothetical protein